MLAMACSFDDIFCDDDPLLHAPKPALVEEMVALARRVVLGVVVRAPRVVATYAPPTHEGEEEVHEVLVRGFIALRSHSAVLRSTRVGGHAPPPPGPRRA